MLTLFQIFQGKREGMSQAAAVGHQRDGDHHLVWAWWANREHLLHLSNNKPNNSWRAQTQHFAKANGKIKVLTFLQLLKPTWQHCKNINTGNRPGFQLTTSFPYPNSDISTELINSFCPQICWVVLLHNQTGLPSSSPQILEIHS